MKSRPVQYLGLVLLVLASLAVIFFPTGMKPEPQNYKVSLVAPKPFQQLAGTTKKVGDEADDALATEFKAGEAIPGALMVGTDGKTAVVVDKATTRGEARARAERIVKALSAKFRGVMLADDAAAQIDQLPQAPLFALGTYAVFAPKERNGSPVPAVKLGLDLQGGVNLVLQVRRAMFPYNFQAPLNGPSARDAFLARIREALNDTDASLGLRNADVGFNSQVDNQIAIRTQAQDEEQFNAQSKAIDAALKGLKDVTFIPAGKPQFYQPKTDAHTAPTAAQDVLRTTVEILRSRVDKLGVSEPLIQAQGTDRIIVQLPGVNDPEKAIKTIGTTAQMQIVLLPQDIQATSDPKDPNNTIFFDKQGQVANDVVLTRCLEETGKELKKVGAADPGDPNQPIVSGVDVEPTTTAGFTEGGSAAIFFRLKGRGSQKFAAVTRDVAGKNRLIPIFLDQKCISAPSVESPITQGQGQITMGSAPIKEAQDLAVLLNSGALPAPIDVVQNSTVSASLGNDSLVKSLRAGLIGILAVAAFMIAYYRLPGLLANCALVIYCILNLAAFVLVGGTLTLPGIAGFLLAVAMSLDTNILVFERLKEEMVIQPTFSAALRAAFSRAWTAILDSHVTTLIASVVLFCFGTGPVKGFALTLGIGVVLSLFSAISVTRLFMWSAVGIGEKNRKLMAGKLPEKDAVMAHHG